MTLYREREESWYDIVFLESKYYSEKKNIFCELFNRLEKFREISWNAGVIYYKDVTYFN